MPLTAASDLIARLVRYAGPEVDDHFAGNDLRWQRRIERKPVLRLRPDGTAANSVAAPSTMPSASCAVRFEEFSVMAKAFRMSAAS